MKNLIYISILIFSFTAKGQQLVQPSQYMLNKFIYNPAAAGSGENNPIGLYVRQQWAGYKSAPSTQLLSMHAKLGESIGLGANIFSDKNGAFKSSGFSGAFSYILTLKEELHLSFGLSASVVQNSLNGSDFVIIDAGDDALNGASVQAIMPDAGFGTLLYGKQFYLGFSALQLLKSSYSFGTSLVGENKQSRHYYINGGYKLLLGPGLKFEPSFLIKASEIVPMQMDFTGRLHYRENIWAGVSYRNLDAFVAMVGMQRDRFMIGYSHDFTSSNLKNYSSGTNELYLQYGFKRKEKGATKFK